MESKVGESKVGESKADESQIVIGFDFDDTLVKLLANAIQHLKPTIELLRERIPGQDEKLNELQQTFTQDNANLWKGFILKVKNSISSAKITTEKIFDKLPNDAVKELFNNSSQNELFIALVRVLKEQIQDKNIDKAPEIEGSVKLLNDLTKQGTNVAIVTNNTTVRVLNSILLQIFDSDTADRLSKMVEDDIDGFNAELKSGLEELKCEENSAESRWKGFVEQNILGCKFFEREEEKEIVSEKTRTAILVSRNGNFALITANGRGAQYKKPNTLMGDDLREVFGLTNEDQVMYSGDKSDVDVQFALNCGFRGVHFSGLYGMDYESIGRGTLESPEIDGSTLLEGFCSPEEKKCENDFSLRKDHASKAVYFATNDSKSAQTAVHKAIVLNELPKPRQEISR